MGSTRVHPDKHGRVVATVTLWLMMATTFVNGQAVDYGGYRPHYQGYGVDTPGGRRGTVCRVTSLDDRAAGAVGTLRHCAERLSGPRFVIFEISGTINLTQGPLYVRNPFITIAGQTAPSPGVLIRGPGVIIDTHDVVLQHLRIRVGNLPDEPIALWLRNDATNVVLDHMSVSWSVWTSVSVSAYTAGHPPGEITMMDSIVAESLGCTVVNRAVPCDPATYPSRGFSNSRAIGIGDAWHNSTPKVTLLRNISANNNDRHPEIGGSTHTFLVNNLIYNPSQTPLSVIFYQDGNHSGPLLSVVRGNLLISGTHNSWPQRIHSGRVLGRGSGQAGTPTTHSPRVVQNLSRRELLRGRLPGRCVSGKHRRAVDARSGLHGGLEQDQRSRLESSSRIGESAAHERLACRARRSVCQSQRRRSSAGQRRGGRANHQ